MNIKKNLQNTILSATFYKALKNKNILLDKIKIISYFKHTILFANIFFRYKKMRKYNKKIYNNKVKLKEHKKIGGLYINFHFNILNQKINQLKASLFFKNFLKMKEIIFIRRPDLFSDFFNLSALLVDTKLSTKLYLQLLGQIFSILLKQKHTKFFLFLKNLFNELIFQKKDVLSKEKNRLSKGKKKSIVFSAIIGIKFHLNGKLKGKPRASSLKIINGKVPCQTVNSNIQYNKITIYNRYGAFGLKL